MSSNYSDSTITNRTVNKQQYKINAKNKKHCNTTVPSNSQNQQIVKQNYSFDTESLAKKYEKHPIDVLNELGYDFTPEERKLISQFICDKKTLIAFLNIVKQEKLTKEDIIAGVQKLKEFVGNGLLSRVKNVFKKLFEGEFTDAFKLAKSERIYHSEQLGENMNEIREERGDYSSETVAEVGDKFAKNKKVKKNGMHFVKKKNTDGSYLYTENDTKNAISKIEGNLDKADEFVGNVVELESITDANNRIKYKGSTIINVSDRMTQKPDLKGTMMLTAKKSDMTDEFLDNITGNLYKNPHMEGSIRFMATSKNADGTDKFSAGNMNSESDYLVDKNETYCQNYNNELESLTKNYNMPADEILETNKKIAENPNAKEEILKEYSSYKSDEATINNQTGLGTNSNYANNQQDKQLTPQNRLTKTETKEDKNNSQKEETVRYNGVEYPRSKIYKELYSRYGGNTEKILQQLEKNPEFIDLMKKYGHNKHIVEAISENPHIVMKLKNSSSSLTVNELADMLQHCKNLKTAELMTNLTSKYNATNAVKIVKNSKLNNTLDETLTLATSQNFSNCDKKERLEQISNNSMNYLYT